MFLVLFLALSDPVKDAIAEARAIVQARQALTWKVMEPEPLPPAKEPVLELPPNGAQVQKEPPKVEEEEPVIPPTLPKRAVEYVPSSLTQEIAVTNGFDRISPVPISHLEAKWHVSGGLLGIRGWRSRKYHVIPEGKYVEKFIGTIYVKNSFGSFQPNRGLMRRYPDGMEFHDVLSNDKGEVFEHRVRRKEDGKWESSIEYENVAARPPGYTGLKVTCASCHNQAGTGGYATGLVPGGDGVLSDPLDWSLLNAPVSQPVQSVPVFAPTRRRGG